MAICLPYVSFSPSLPFSVCLYIFKSMSPSLSRRTPTPCYTHTWCLPALINSKTNYKFQPTTPPAVVWTAAEETLLRLTRRISAINTSWPRPWQSVTQDRDRQRHMKELQPRGLNRTRRLGYSPEMRIKCPEERPLSPRHSPLLVGRLKCKLRTLLGPLPASPDDRLASFQTPRLLLRAPPSWPFGVFRRLAGGPGRCLIRKEGKKL